MITSVFRRGSCVKLDVPTTLGVSKASSSLHAPCKRALVCQNRVGMGWQHWIKSGLILVRHGAHDGTGRITLINWKATDYMRQIDKDPYRSIWWLQRLCYHIGTRPPANHPVDSYVTDERGVMSVLQIFPGQSISLGQERQHEEVGYPPASFWAMGLTYHSQDIACEYVWFASRWFRMSVPWNMWHVLWYCVNTIRRVGLDSAFGAPIFAYWCIDVSGTWVIIGLDNGLAPNRQAII